MLGVVIANWNGEKLIDKCLMSLVNQTYKNFKVYIIDNNSKDESIERIDSYNDKLKIELTKLEYNSGFAIANNIGIKQAIDDGCEYVLTLNNDIEVPEESLQLAMEEVLKQNADFYQLFMINYFDRKKCDAAGLVFKKDLTPLQIGFNETVDSLLSREINIEGVCAGAAIYSSKALEDVKENERDYFDPNFFAYYEDVDLSLRLINKGYKAKLLMNSKVYHMHSATSSKNTGLKDYYLIRNLFIYTKKNQTAEEMKKNEIYYYIRFMKNTIKNLTHFKTVKCIFKGLRDGLKERKNISFLERSVRNEKAS